VIPIGFEGEGVKKKEKKKDLENVLYWEEWGNGRRPAPFEEELEDYGPYKVKKK
jgi:hypothetical protein